MMIGHDMPAKRYGSKAGPSSYEIKSHKKSIGIYTNHFIAR